MAVPFDLDRLKGNWLGGSRSGWCQDRIPAEPLSSAPREMGPWSIFRVAPPHMEP